jgi:hypothetical protein
VPSSGSTSAAKGVSKLSSGCKPFAFATGDEAGTVPLELKQAPRIENLSIRRRPFKSYSSW